MTSLIHALDLALLHFIWQGALIASLLWMALVGMRRSSANARYLVSCAALGALVLAPAITVFWMYQRPGAAAMGAASAGAPVFFQFSATGAHWSALETWALPLWSLGVALFSMRLLWGARSVAAMRRRGVPAEEWICAAVARLAQRMGVQRAVRVLMSELADGPSVIGLLKPAILLPAAAISGLAPDQLEAVLAHELAHIRRYDYLVNVAQMLVEALLFYHPAVWWISSRIRMERELCCDDCAVLACGDGLRYARALTMLERLRVSAPALGAMDGPLAYRIKRLMGVAAEERGTSELAGKLAGAVALCAALALLGASVARVRAQVQPDAPGVHVDLGASAVIHRTPVEYPAAAQTKNVQGTITVELRLDSSGNVTDAHVLSGPDELRKTVLQSVLGWHFTPQSAGSTKVVNVQFQTPAPKEAASVVPAPSSDDRNDKTMEFMRSELQRLEAQSRAVQARVEQNQAQVEQNQDVIAAREAVAQIAQLRAQLERAQIAAQMEKAQNPEGRTVRSIRLVGLGISLEDFLAQSQLPLRAGDTLTQGSIEAATAAISKFDEHLSVGWIPVEPNSVDLTIAAPGARIPGGRGGRGGAAPPEPPQPPDPTVDDFLGAQRLHPEVADTPQAPDAPQAGAYRIGNGVSAPVPVYQPQPGYTEEAKNAKWQGAVMLSVVIDETGKPVHLKVTKSLGMGLDEKAIEAVEQWKFQPGMKDGKPVPVLATIEVNFHLP
jgi:TonB family protein